MENTNNIEEQIFSFKKLVIGGLALSILGIVIEIAMYPAIYYDLFFIY